MLIETGISGKKKNDTSIDGRICEIRASLSIAIPAIRGTREHVKRSYRGWIRQPYKYCSQQALSLRTRWKFRFTFGTRSTRTFQAPLSARNRDNFNSILSLSIATLPRGFFQLKMNRFSRRCERDPSREIHQSTGEAVPSARRRSRLSRGPIARSARPGFSNIRAMIDPAVVIGAHQMERSAGSAARARAPGRIRRLCAPRVAVPRHEEIVKKKKKKETRRKSRGRRRRRRSKGKRIVIA